MDDGLGAQGAIGRCHATLTGVRYLLDQPCNTYWCPCAQSMRTHTMQARKKATKVIEEEEEPEEASVPEAPTFARRCV